MKPFKNLIEFITRRGKHFYNKDIKCPVCGETMWWDDSNIDVNTDHKTLRVICKHECCTMEIKFEDYILWDDKV